MELQQRFLAGSQVSFKIGSVALEQHVSLQIHCVRAESRLDPQKKTYFLPWKGNFPQDPGQKNSLSSKKHAVYSKLKLWKRLQFRALEKNYHPRRINASCVCGMLLFHSMSWPQSVQGRSLRFTRLTFF